MEQQKRVVDDGNLFSWIQINKKYFRTTPGITKIIQVVSTFRLVSYSLIRKS